MHISDGILSAPVLVTGFVGTAALAAWSLKDLDMEEIPKVSVLTSVFFVASLIHVPIGPTSVHLILNGLVGVVLGRRAFVAILLGLVLQALLFGHGGLTVLGVNALMMGGGGLMAYWVWQQRHHFTLKRKEFVFGALAGATGTIVSGTVLALALVTTGEAFFATAGYVLAVHIPIMVVEAIVVGGCASFLKRTKPDVLAGERPAAAAAE